MNDSNWIDVSRKAPCPICGHDSWCTVSSDGRVVNCRRVDAGGRSKTDKNGAPFWVHFLDSKDSSGAIPVKPPISSKVTV